MSIQDSKYRKSHLIGDLRRTVEERDTLQGRAFDFAVQALIVISMVSFSIDTVAGIPDHLRVALHWIELTIVVAFTAEYVLRLFVAKNKMKFVFSFFGLIDLAAILPFYLALSVDLRSIRVFRLLRLFRTLKFLRYSRAIRRFHRAFIFAREELVLFFSVAGILFYVSAVGIYYFENSEQPEAFGSIFHSLWWAVITLTTVGYGDVYPITTGGKFFTFIVLMLGLGVVAVPSGLVASALSEARRAEDSEKNAVQDEEERDKQPEPGQ